MPYASATVRVRRSLETRPIRIDPVRAPCLRCVSDRMRSRRSPPRRSDNTDPFTPIDKPSAPLACGTRSSAGDPSQLRDALRPMLFRSCSICGFRGKSSWGNVRHGNGGLNHNGNRWSNCRFWLWLLVRVPVWRGRRHRRRERAITPQASGSVRHELSSQLLRGRDSSGPARPRCWNRFPGAYAMGLDLPRRMTGCDLSRNRKMVPARRASRSSVDRGDDPRAGRQSDPTCSCRMCPNRP